MDTSNIPAATDEELDQKQRFDALQGLLLRISEPMVSEPVTQEVTRMEAWKRWLVVHDPNKDNFYDMKRILRGDDVFWLCPYPQFNGTLEEANEKGTVECRIK